MLDAAIDGVKHRDGGMPLQHRGGLPVDESVDLGVRCSALQDREHGRGHQHIAMMAQLDHQRTADAGEVDRVVDGRRNHAGNDSTKRGEVAGNFTTARCNIGVMFMSVNGGASPYNPPKEPGEQ